MTTYFSDEIQIFGYEEFQLMMKINNRGRDQFNEGDYGQDTCADYFDSIAHKDGLWGVAIFVEPCGNLAKWGKSIMDCLKWWDTVFSLQPEYLSYINAGWFLDWLEGKGFPDDSKKVWGKYKAYFDGGKDAQP